MKTEVWAILLVIASTLIGSWGALFLKLGVDAISLSIKSIVTSKLILLGLFLFGFSSVFFIIALQGGQLSVLYPLVSLSYVWVTLVSMKFLGEEMNIAKLVGISSIIVGVVLIGIGKV